MKASPPKGLWKSCRAYKNRDRSRKAMPQNHHISPLKNGGGYQVRIRAAGAVVSRVFSSSKCGSPLDALYHAKKYRDSMLPVLRKIDKSQPRIIAAGVQKNNQTGHNRIGIFKLVLKSGQHVRYIRATRPDGRQKAWSLSRHDYDDAINQAIKWRDSID